MIHKRNLLPYLILSALALFTCTDTISAQTNVKAPVDEVNKAARGVSDSISGYTQRVNEELQKQTDKVNKTADKAAEKIDEQLDKVTERTKSITEKIKNATIRKNTWVTRTYHNVTAYYNVYFNANESFKEGIKAAAENYPFDFTNILPVFVYADEAIPGLVTAQMERTLDKSRKTITEHSITNKPKLKKGKRLTKKQQDFYNKREFCNRIDDAYLLIGKSNMYLHEYDLAQRAFDHIVLEYPTGQTTYEARIWSAILEGEMGNPVKENDLLEVIENDKNFPKKYNSLLHEARSDAFIRNKEYQKAIPYMEKALDKACDRLTKQRYNYILAQLYQQNGNNRKAVSHYSAVIRRNPSQDMDFNAKLNRASLASGRVDNIRRMLVKMSKEEKNEDFLDKIYFALAEVEMRAKNQEKAVEYYKLSAAHSKGESPQRLLSCYTLAQYFEGVGDFESAQAYYDSTAMIMPKTNPDYYLVNNKAQNLNILASNLRIIKTEDSLQRIARMSEKERNAYVNRMIAQAKAESRQREKEEAHKAAQQTIAAGSTPTAAGGKWYFYNASVTRSGANDFKKTWGSRQLADNWRINRSAGGAGGIGDSNDTESTSVPEVDITPEDQTPEYYLADVPLTPELLEKSNNRIMNAMFDAGKAYKDYINDNKKAIEMFEDLLKRYPNTEHKMVAYFYLYTLNEQEGNSGQAQQYKNRLISEFPNEPLTLYVKNPEYQSGREVAEKNASTLYEEIFNLYSAGKYTQAIQKAEMGLKEYADLDIAAYFSLIKVMSQSGIDKNIGSYIAGLQDVMSEYKDSDAAKTAQELMEVIRKQEPTIMREREGIFETAPVVEQKPPVQYSTVDEPAYYVTLVDKAATNLNQLRFNIISFNADIDADDMSVEVRNLSNDISMVLVSPFNSVTDAMRYYKIISGNRLITKDLELPVYTTFIITKGNLSLFQEDKVISTYVDFFNANIK
ncbi:MAG: tetratricopeptide repeat protein [Prevotellaceae bacterium]|nr:tetratricopeptide repeat protein [Prevotellaceae bacterium]